MSTTSIQEPWTTRRLLTWMGDHFASRGIEGHDVMAQVLLGHVLAVEPIMLFTDPDRPTTAEELDRLRPLVRRAADDEPVQYLVGEGPFLGRPFHVGPEVLIPRSSSESIIQCVLDRHRGGAAGGAVPVIRSVADIGTGSGCLAITLAIHIPGVRVTATDLSTAAIDIARANARRHGVEDRIDFVVGDGCAPLEAAAPEGGFDLVVSNPPYIADHTWPTLDANVREHEPTLALRGGPDGLDVIRPLLDGIGAHLASDGMLVLEFGDDQAAPVRAHADGLGLGSSSIVRDMHGDERLLVIDRSISPTT
ncbi:MAG: peptide chain release factor N(5)-glutamine methyltransferase [Planctomycetota bacterium]|nr:peptide chain release factor N(5)-glutamine methyltransferase [Planctomycetota bacterium]